MLPQPYSNYEMVTCEMPSSHRRIRWSGSILRHRYRVKTAPAALCSWVLQRSDKFFFLFLMFSEQRGSPVVSRAFVRWLCSHDNRREYSFSDHGITSLKFRKNILLMSDQLDEIRLMLLELQTTVGLKINNFIKTNTIDKLGNEWYLQGQQQCCRNGRQIYISRSSGTWNKNLRI